MSYIYGGSSQSVQTQNCVDATLAGNTAGVLALVSSGTMTLAGGNNITLSQAGNAITISAPNLGAGAGFTAGMSNLGNTSGTTGVADSILYLAGGNGITLSQSLDAANHSGTVTISGYAGGTVSQWFAMPADAFVGGLGASNEGTGIQRVWPVNMDGYFSASRANLFVSLSVSSSSNSSHGGTISAWLLVYTRNGSSLSMASSGSTNHVWTNTSNNSTGSLSFIRQLSIPINVNFTPGNYWLAAFSNTASANANWFTASQVFGTLVTGTFAGEFGATNHTTKQFMLGWGSYSVQQLGTLGSFGFTDIVGGQNVVRHSVPFCQFVNFSV